MTLQLRRVILFTRDVPALTAFYRDVIGLAVLPGAEDGWVELEAGGCRIALHKSGANIPGTTKLAFGAQDVAATREQLLARGAKFGPLRRSGPLELCNGSDPDGNELQLSNRP
jgi:catechol 2,3-dioxygenase-like lactoylglutathione lyase family enzyme